MEISVAQDMKSTSKESDTVQLHLPWGLNRRLPSTLESIYYAVGFIS